MEKIKEIWMQPTRDVNTLDMVLFKLKKVKKYLKGWRFNKAGDSKRRKREIEKPSGQYLGLIVMSH
jgi:hypothetical protein